VLEQEGCALVRVLLEQGCEPASGMLFMKRFKD